MGNSLSVNPNNRVGKSNVQPSLAFRFKDFQSLFLLLFSRKANRQQKRSSTLGHPESELPDEKQETNPV